MTYYLENSRGTREITFSTVKSYIRSSYQEVQVPHIIYDLFENGFVNCRGNKIIYKHDVKYIQKLLGTQSEENEINEN